jgi:hypothetical protein
MKGGWGMEITNADAGTRIDEIDVAPIVETDILGPSEATRRMMDYYSHTKNVVPLMEKLARCEPTTLACMHGSSWRGDGGKLLRELAKVLDG